MFNKTTTPAISHATTPHLTETFHWKISPFGPNDPDRDAFWCESHQEAIWQARQLWQAIPMIPDKILKQAEEAALEDMNAPALLAIPGVIELVLEHENNAILEDAQARWVELAMVALDPEVTT